MDDRTSAITQAIDAMDRGEPRATLDLLPLLYDELHQLARARLSKLPPGQTLAATALVHEAYLRISGRQPDGWDGRRHFFFAAARAMRDILVEDARRKNSLKRGGNYQRVTLAGLGMTIDAAKEELLALDEALQELEKTDPENYQLVMLRYFGGLSNEETAEVLETSLSTVKRKWRFVRAWLLKAIDGVQDDDSDSAGDPQ